MHRERESGFDLTFATSKLPEYNGLFDKNLRHYFENRKVQKHLSRVGMVRACVVTGEDGRWQARGRWQRSEVLTPAPVCFPGRPHPHKGCCFVVGVGNSVGRRVGRRVSFVCGCARC